MNQTLYDIAAEYEQAFQAIEDLAEENGGEITPEQMAVLDSIECTLAEKLDACASMILEYENRSEFAKRQAKRLNERAAQNDKRAANLELYVSDSMKKLEMRKHIGKRFTVSIQNNPPRVEITDPDALPIRFKEEVVEIKIDKNAIKAELNSAPVPGAKLVQGDRLVIK